MIRGVLILTFGLWMGWQGHAWKSNHDTPPGREAYVYVCIHNDGEVLMGKGLVWCHLRVAQ